MHIMKGRLSLVDAEHHRDETGKVDQIPVIDALVSFDRAIEIDRESGLAWLGRARALRYQGAFDEAEVALVRARRLIPNTPRFRWRRHSCSWRLETWSRQTH